MRFFFGRMARRTAYRLSCGSERRCRRGIAVLPAVLVGLVLSCRGGDDVGGDATAELQPVVVRTDPAGVVHVANSEPLWREERGWRVSPNPVLRIGRLEGPEPYLFGKVAGVTRLSDGGIVVVDEMTSELRAYSAEGAHEWTVGGPGDGPGEFRHPRGVRALPGDTIQVEDRLSRVRFTSAGELLEHRRVDWAGLNRLGRFSWDCRLVSTFVADQLLLTPCTDSDKPSETGPWSYGTEVVRVPWSLDSADTLGFFLQEATWAFGYSRGSTWMMLPFRTRGIFSVGGSPARFVFARSDRYALHVYELQRRTSLRVVEKVPGRRPPTQDEIALEMAGWEKWADQMKQLTGAAGFNAVRRSLPLPDSVATVKSLLVDELGGIWVEQGVNTTDVPEEWIQQLVDEGYLEAGWLERRSPDAHWDVFREDGRYLGQITLPTRFTPHEIGEDYILGVTRDELNVEYITMYGLDRGG